MNAIRALGWSFLLLFAVAGWSIASDTPSVPNTQTVSGEALFQETIELIRQRAPIPKRAQLRGLPAEVILRHIGKPEAVWPGTGKEEWFYTAKKDGEWFDFCIVVRAGRLESIGYHHWW